MAVDPVPWLIAGGAVHSSEVARTLAYQATGGVNGIATALDLAVKPLASPGGSVRVTPGAAAIVGTYAGQSAQSYIARVISDTNVVVPPTSGSPRSDMVVLRVDDPQYGGSTPPSVPNGPYTKVAIISNVGAGATQVPGSVPYPAIPLARIDIPASTSVIQASHIIDLRKLAAPKTERHDYTDTGSGVGYLSSSASADGHSWPKPGGYSIMVPTWATKVRILGIIGGIKSLAGSNQGHVWLTKIGAVSGTAVSSPAYYDTPDNVTGDVRYDLVVATTFDLTADDRGVNTYFGFRSLVDVGSGPNADLYTNIYFQVEFFEDPATS